MIQVQEKRQMPVPKGPLNPRIFMGLKAHVPSGIFDFQL